VHSTIGPSVAREPREYKSTVAGGDAPYPGLPSSRGRVSTFQ
jgi:hypothetical protein